MIAQGSEYPLKKPPGFHWDFFLLGITTFLAGLLGLPAPNGLIPQAPLHTASLVIMGYEDDDHTAVNTPDRETVATAIQMEEMEHGRPITGSEDTVRRVSSRSEKPTGSENKGSRKEVPVAVVEQRVSNLAQGALCEYH